MQNNPEHKIAALLAVSFAGDEITAEQKDYRSGIITARLGKHKGAIIESAENGLVAEFDETADAVYCAIDIQSKLAEHNTFLNPKHAGVRIGIHYGEIFSSEGKLIGNGIDGARSLIETVPLSKIFITREGFRRVRAMLPLKAESAGTQILPHQKEPVEIFSILWEAVKADMEASLKRLEQDDFHRTAITIPRNAPAVQRRKKSPMIFLIVVVVIFFLLKYFHVL